MAEIAYKQLRFFEEALRGLGSLSLPVPLMLRVAKVRKQVLDEIEVVGPLYDKLVEVHGTVNGDGEKIVIPGKAGWTAYSAARKELDAQTFSVVGSLKLSEILPEMEKKREQPEGLANIFAGLGSFLEWDSV